MTDALRHLAVTRAGAVATVTLDRPSVNAVDLEADAASELMRTADAREGVPRAAPAPLQRT